MELIIDTRETKLKEHFQEYINTTIEQLDIGDIIFKHNHEIVTIIERKTLTDLISSVKDGRYKEQKMRLTNSGIPIEKIMYLIETPLINDKTAFGCIIGTLFRDNIKVFRTVDINETIAFIDRIYHRLHENPEKILCDGVTNMNYSETLKLKKKENLTPSVCQVLQLSQIPGVSNRTATCVLENYKSIYELCKIYSTQDELNNVTLLSELTFDSNGKKKKIGNVLSNRIYCYLTGKDF